MRPLTLRAHRLLRHPTQGDEHRVDHDRAHDDEVHRRARARGRLRLVDVDDGRERLTHAHDGPLAVFLIGLRVHQPWRIGVVGQAVRAMPRMIAELEQNKAAAARGEAESLGYLGSRSTVHLSGTTMIQYWRTVDDIHAYASSAGHEHRPAWLEFHSVARAAPRAVTIWHETYAVQPGGAESVYAGAKPFGLGAVAGTIPVARRGEHARDRIGRRAA